ncbi:MAG TPA: hypothetical protein VMT64_10165 [Candidatus Binataceae bacterium]|nr:hypothetical protein [Candidatus Binataceae bacterium]
MPKTINRADRIVRTRMREDVAFPSLTENRTIKLSSVSEYTGRSHFGPWQRILAGMHSFEQMSGIFTPLVYVELETTDAVCDPNSKLTIQGESFLGKSLDETGAVRRIVREGRHVVLDPGGIKLASARMLNVFTRYDPDPAKRRVIELPPELGLGAAPTRIIEVPELETIVDRTRKPDFLETQNHVWTYDQTDPNRHVNGTSYLRAMQEHVADLLHASGHDLKRLYAARARIVYRKPSFRGEAYRRAVWFRSEAPLALAGAFFGAQDAASATPSVAVELTFQQHPT